jgi:hypothetical protein
MSGRRKATNGRKRVAKIFHKNTFDLSRPGRLEVVYVETPEPIDVRIEGDTYYVNFPKRGTLTLSRAEFQQQLDAEHFVWAPR